jgi:uncharacterized membrane protein YuzA (DUF378 family)
VIAAGTCDRWRSELVALARFDLVATLLGMSFGQTSVLSSLVYGLLGLSGLYQLVALSGAVRHE